MSARSGIKGRGRDLCPRTPAALTANLRGDVGLVEPASQPRSYPDQDGLGAGDLRRTAGSGRSQ